MSDESLAGESQTVHPLWDKPVRLIHWSIAFLMLASWWTAEEGQMERHGLIGLAILVLVLTRLVWGFVGSPQALFTDFLRGPGTAMAYLRGAPSGTPGHNPLGGWSAMMLWLLLLVQAVSGTFNADDVLFTGPFHYVFDSSVTDVLAQIHEVGFNVLSAFVALHVGTIVFYEWRRDQRLVYPMVVGEMDGREGTGPAQPLLKALLIAVLWALLLALLIDQAPEPAPLYW